MTLFVFVRSSLRLSVQQGRIGLVRKVLAVQMTDFSVNDEGGDAMDPLLNSMEASLVSRRAIALWRIRCLYPNFGGHHTMESIEESQRPIPTGDGLAAVFVPLLSQAVFHFLEATKRSWTSVPREIPEGNDVPESDADFPIALRRILRLLRIYHAWVRLDPVLAEELARHGAHRALIQLMQYAFPPVDLPQNESTDAIQDRIEEVQDLAGSIAADSRPSFPIVSIQPFSRADLLQRLPLPLDFTPSRVVPAPLATNPELVADPTDVTILLHQITARQSAQADVGFVLWPSAVVLATLMVRQHLEPWDASNEGPFSIIELGAGCGLSGLVAARWYSRMRRDPPTVVLTDFNARVLENLLRNIDLNDLSPVCSVADLDFYQQSGVSQNHWKTMDGTLRDPVDIILAADVICEASDAMAVANTIQDVLKPGGTAYVVCADAKHRFGVDRLIGECHRVGLTVSTQTMVCSHDVHDELSTAIQLSKEDQLNLEKTTGFVYGMRLTLFTIVKSSCI